MTTTRLRRAWRALVEDLNPHPGSTVEALTRDVEEAIDALPAIDPLSLDDLGRFRGAEKPTIVCLCGSTRFIDAFRRAEFEETLAGRIVLTIGCDTKSDDELFTGEAGAQVKLGLDELHLRKIDLADEVLILNVGNYVGASTRREAWYALETGKRLRWLEPVWAYKDAIANRLDGSDLTEHVRSWFADWDAWHAAAMEAAS